MPTLTAAVGGEVVLPVGVALAAVGDGAALTASRSQARLWGALTTKVALAVCGEAALMARISLAAGAVGPHWELSSCSGRAGRQSRC